MVELCAEADIYRDRMRSFLDQRNAEMEKNPKNEQGRIALFNAEWTFAEQCFLELSRQAAAYEARLHKINVALGRLSLERDQLHLHVGCEMRSGYLAQGVTEGESSNT